MNSVTQSKFATEYHPFSTQDCHTQFIIKQSLILYMYLREGVDEMVDIGCHGCGQYFFIGHLPEVGSIADVFGDAGIKQNGFLEHNAQLGTQPANVQVLNVDRIQ